MEGGGGGSTPACICCCWQEARVAAVAATAAAASTGYFGVDFVSDSIFMVCDVARVIMLAVLPARQACLVGVAALRAWLCPVRFPGHVGAHRPQMPRQPQPPETRLCGAVGSAGVGSVRLLFSCAYSTTYHLGKSMPFSIMNSYTLRYFSYLFSAAAIFCGLSRGAGSPPMSCISTAVHPALLIWYMMLRSDLLRQSSTVEIPARIPARRGGASNVGGISCCGYSGAGELGSGCMFMQPLYSMHSALSTVRHIFCAYFLFCA